jgi:hypothetical protein
LTTVSTGVGWAGGGLGCGGAGVGVDVGVDVGVGVGEPDAGPDPDEPDPGKDPADPLPDPPAACVTGRSPVRPTGAGAEWTTARRGATPGTTGSEAVANPCDPLRDPA